MGDDVKELLAQAKAVHPEDDGPLFQYVPKETAALRRNLRKAFAKIPLATASPTDFDEIVDLIEAARTRAVSAVNQELIDLYCNIGATISRRITADGWGQGTVQALADHIRNRHPSMSGFSAQNLWRMRQFFDTYQGQSKLSTLLRELSWSHNLPRHWLPNTRPACPTKSSCKPSCTSSTPWRIRNRRQRCRSDAVKRRSRKSDESSKQSLQCANAYELSGGDGGQTIRVEAIDDPTTPVGHLPAVGDKLP